MKSILKWATLLAVTCSLAGCGVGAPAVNTATTSVKQTNAYLAFSAAKQQAIVVTVDGREYRTETVKIQGSNSARSIQEMAGNVITLAPGSHEIVVKDSSGRQLYRQKLSVSAQEHKVIDL